MPPPRPRQLVPFSWRESDTESQDLVILQLNVEGLTLPKLDVLEHVTATTKANVVLLQETHKENKTILKLPDITLAGHTNSKYHGLATFVKNYIKWELTGKSPEDAAVEWLTIMIHDTTIVNIYKPPPIRFEQSSLSVLQPQPSTLETSTAATWTGDTRAAIKTANSWWTEPQPPMPLCSPKEPATFIERIGAKRLSRV